MFAPRGIRNNNFGNIEDGSFAQSLPGYAGGDGRFARFASPDDGMAAIDRLLGVYGSKHGINSINGVINRWAPASDGNHVANYAGHVAQVAGVDPNAPIDLSDPAVRAKLARGMAEFENGPQAFAAVAGDKWGGSAAPVSPVSTSPAPAAPQPTELSSQSRRPGNFGTFMPPSKATRASDGPDFGSYIGLPGYDVPGALQGAGAALASISSPEQGTALARIAAAQTKTGKWSMHFDPATGTMFRINNESGQVERASQGAPQPKLTEGALKAVGEVGDKYGMIHQISQEAAEIRDLIDKGTLNLGAFNSWVQSGKNLAGMSDAQSRAYAKYEAFRQQLANDQLLQAKGVQTEGDAYRAMRQFSAGNANYDNETAKQALDHLITRNREAINNGSTTVEAHRRAYGDHEAFKPVADKIDSYKRFYTDLDERRKKTAPPTTGNFGSIKQKYGLE